MASRFVQAGSSLYRQRTDGVSTVIALPQYPTPVTLYGASRPLRATGFTYQDKPITIFVNGGSEDFYVDTFGVARSLQLAPPMIAPVPSAGAGTGLTGVYKVAATFKVKDANGATLMESGLSPISVATSALVNKTIALANIPVSADGSVNARGLYRTLSGGDVLYPWFDMDNNLDLTEDRGVADASLSVLGTNVTRYGQPPDLSLVTVWNDQVWGVPRLQPDHVRWTDPRLFYGWSPDNEILAPPTNSDAYGVTALIPRRDNLGIAKRKRLYMVTGSGNDSFQRVGVSETLGFVSQESIVVIENEGYGLGETGVNVWSDEGIVSISDDQVQAWFTTDDFFNRSQFYRAQGRYCEDSDSYELLLCSAGSTTFDRWVSYDRRGKRWSGPHKTVGFTPTCCATGTSLRGLLDETSSPALTVFGASDGWLYKRDPNVITDGALDPTIDSVSNLAYAAGLSWTHVCAVGTTLLVALIRDDGAAVTTVTYNGVAMTLGDSVVVSGGFKYYAYYQFNPASGSHTIAVGGSATIAAIGVSYRNTGTTLDAHATNSGTSLVTLRTSLTTLVDRSLVLYFVADRSGGVPSALENIVAVGNAGGAASMIVFDAGGAVPDAGVTTMIATVNGTAGGVMLAFPPTATVNTVGAVPMEIQLPFLSVSEPDITKLFERPTIHTRAETSGVLTVTPIVGTLESAASQSRSHNLQLDRELLPMLGVGRYCQLTLTHSAATERPRIFGIEIPYTFLGRR